MDSLGRFRTTFLVPEAAATGCARHWMHPTCCRGARRRRRPSPSLPDLALGAHGFYVALLERRLVELHYHLVGVDDVFDYRTADAVMAFRKVQGMARTQTVDAATWRALGSPKLFVPRHRAAGVHIEVDQTRQVLAVVRDGEVEDIIHVSTGKPSTPTRDGSFHVFSKLAGFSSKSCTTRASSTASGPSTAGPTSRTTPPVTAASGSRTGWPCGCSTRTRSERRSSSTTERSRVRRSASARSGDSSSGPPRADNPPIPRIPRRDHEGWQDLIRRRRRDRRRPDRVPRRRGGLVQVLVPAG